MTCGREPCPAGVQFVLRFMSKKEIPLSGSHRVEGPYPELARQWPVSPWGGMSLSFSFTPMGLGTAVGRPRPTEAWSVGASVSGTLHLPPPPPTTWAQGPLPTSGPHWAGTLFSPLVRVPVSGSSTSLPAPPSPRVLEQILKCFTFGTTRAWTLDFQLRFGLVQHLRPGSSFCPRSGA